MFSPSLTTRPNASVNAIGHVRSLLGRWQKLSRREAQQIVDTIHAAGLEPTQLGVNPDVLRAVHQLAQGDARAIRQLEKQRGNMPAFANAGEPFGLSYR